MNDPIEIATHNHYYEIDREESRYEQRRGEIKEEIFQSKDHLKELVQEAILENLVADELTMQILEELKLKIIL